LDHLPDSPQNPMKPCATNRDTEAGSQGQERGVRSKCHDEISPGRPQK